MRALEKLHNSWLVLLTIIFFGLSACTKKAESLYNTDASKNSSNNNFVVDNLKVLNAAFFSGVNTPQHSYLAGGDGSIIYSSDDKKWHAANTDGMFSNITSLSTNTNGDELIATGENGLLGYSINGGKDWKKIPLGITQHIYTSLYDPSHKTWVAAGAEGILLWSNSVNSGWQLINKAGSASAITNIQYLEKFNALLAIGDGGLLLISSDGGKTWENITSTNETLNSQIHGNNFHIIPTANGNVLRSDDNIKEWKSIEISKNANLIKAAIDKDHNTIAIISSDGDIFISDDTGKNWGFSYSANQTLRNIIYSEQHHNFIVVGNEGTLLFSDDGGRVWNKSSSRIEGSFDSVFTLNNYDILAAGDGGLLALSSDGGKSWQKLQDAITEFIHQVIVSADDKRLIAVGTNGLLLSTNDNGKRWQKNTTLLNNNDYIFSIVSDKKSKTMVAGGSPGTIIQSTDEGKSWQIKLALGDASKGSFHKIIRDNNKTLVALAGPGTSYYSSDNGDTWQEANINNEQHLFSGAYDYAHNRFIAVGNAGIIQLSTNGKDWKIANSGTTDNLQNVYVVTENLFVVGSNGIILRSQDGGKNWNTLQSNTHNAIQYLFPVPDSKIIIATGSRGLMLRSTDNGEHWQTINSPESSNLREAVQDQTTGIIYVPSRAGNILFSRDKGETWAAMPQVTQHSIKGIIIDNQEKILIGYGERLIRIPLLK